jgi:hypothetical protein
VLYVRARDAAGNVEKTFSARRGNKKTFRVKP